MLRLVLVGGGHAHLHVLSELSKYHIENLEVMLISSSRYAYYSGMISGFVEGIYTEDQVRIPLDLLCERMGFGFKQGEVTSVNPYNQSIEINSCERITYQLISFNVGSLSANDHLAGVQEFAWTIKPLEKLTAFISQLSINRNIVIAGGGASAVELSMAIHSRMRQVQQFNSITLITQREIMSNSSPSVTKHIRQMIIHKGITVLECDPVASVEQNVVNTSSGRKIAFDQLLWLTGPQAHPFFRDSGLPVDDDGYLQVNRWLQVSQFPHIFGAGDCIRMTEYPLLPKAGVFAVRQGEVLARNIRHYILQEKLLQYKPRKSYVAILSLGNKEGLMMYNKWAIRSKWAWTLKYMIDISHMNKYLSRSDSDLSNEH